MNVGKCANCRFWVDSTYCCRYPPVAQRVQTWEYFPSGPARPLYAETVTLWPETGGQQFCGEFALETYNDWSAPVETP